MGAALMPMIFIFGILSLVGSSLIKAATAKRQLVPEARGPFTPLLQHPLTPAPAAGASHVPAPAPIAAPARTHLSDLPPLRTRRLTGGRRLFLACFVPYLVIGAILALKFESFNGDAQARLANAYYVLFSRDPHLAAIGFVWNPLPSLLLMPLLPFKLLWAPLTTYAFAGNIESAFFMAACVCVLARILEDLRLSLSTRIVIVLVFAANPMVIYYGANAMSEALFLLLLLLATLYLLRWLETESLRALALAGVWLGVAYLARNEAIAAGGFVTLLVAGRAWLRTGGPRRDRLIAAAADSVIVATPIGAAFVGWAACSYVIVGSPFEQFSSEYGTTSQLKVLGDTLTGTAGMAAPQYMAVQVLTFAPLLPVIVGLLVARARRCRELRSLGVMAVLGGVLAFSVLGYIAGKTAGWYRYNITALPLSLLLAACLLAGAPSPGEVLRRFSGRLAALSAPVVAAVLLAPSLSTTAWAMMNPRIGREERSHLVWLFREPRDRGEIGERDRLATVRSISGYIDDLHLKGGSVILDTFSPCSPMIVLASSRPKQFVITNDRDFEPILADPVTFKAKYIMVPPNGGYGSLDAVNRAYPELYDQGGGLARLEKEFNGPGCPPFRLYEVTAKSVDVDPSRFPTRGGGN